MSKVVETVAERHGQPGLPSQLREVADCIDRLFERSEAPETKLRPTDSTTLRRAADLLEEDTHP